MKKILLLIIFIAAVLRLWQLGQVPPSPDWDEAALGYNAYSIMQTGRDEYGKLFPVVLRSFDDYKPALYAYLAIPFVKAFGLEVWAVRLPSAIFGILTVLTTYFLTIELFKKFETEKKNLTSHFLASRSGSLLTSFLLAISPWHIQFSRIAFEANVGLAFNVFAIFFFLKGLKKPVWLLLSAFTASLNFYVYQSEKVFTPLIFIALLIIFRKEIFAISKKYLMVSVLIALFVAMPMLNFMLVDKAALSRAQGVSFFSDKTPFLKENVQRLIIDRQNNDILGLILDNRRIVYFKTFLANYLSHFELNWFLKGDLPRHHAPNMGVLYIFELPFLLIGIYAFTFGNFDRKIKALIFFWFLISPIPASFTSGVPHAIRTLNFLPTFQIFTAIGILFAFRKLSDLSLRHLRYLIFSFIFLFFLLNFFYYLNQYFVQLNYFTSQDWQYGYKKAVSKVWEIKNNYQKIVVSNKPYLDQSYMFFLFYSKYPPSLYQKESVLSSGGFRENHKFDKFEFRPIEWENENSGTLLVGMPSDFPQGSKVIETINFLDGTPAISIIEK